LDHFQIILSGVGESLTLWRI